MPIAPEKIELLDGVKDVLDAQLAGDCVYGQLDAPMNLRCGRVSALQPVGGGRWHEPRRSQP